MPLTAIAINCSLTAKGPSSTDAMIKVLGDAFGENDVKVGETIRIAAFDVKPGVTSDERRATRALAATGPRSGRRYWRRTY